MPCHWQLQALCLKLCSSLVRPGSISMLELVSYHQAPWLWSAAVWRARTPVITHQLNMSVALTHLVIDCTVDTAPFKRVVFLCYVIAVILKFLFLYFISIINYVCFYVWYVYYFECSIWLKIYRGLLGYQNVNINMCGVQVVPYCTMK